MQGCCCSEVLVDWMAGLVSTAVAGEPSDSGMMIGSSAPLEEMYVHDFIQRGTLGYASPPA